MRIFRGAAGWLLACAMLLTMTPRAEACSCAWSGSFVRMAAGSEVVIRGVVRDYRNGPQGFPQVMVVGKVTGDDPAGRDQTVPLARLRELLRSRS